MEIIFYYCLISIVSFVTIIYLDKALLPKLPDSNSFKKWWKKHIIDEAPKNIDL